MSTMLRRLVIVFVLAAGAFTVGCSHTSAAVSGSG